MQYLSMGLKVISEELFNEVKNDWIKPIGGLWASPYIPDDNYSEWVKWCQSEMPEWIKEYGVVFSIKKDAKIYVIDSFEDLKRLITKYPYSGLGNGVYELLKAKDLIIGINFEELKKEYDGIFMTSKGENETRYTRPTLYGWDCESLLVLNFDIIEEQKQINIILGGAENE